MGEESKASNALSSKSQLPRISSKPHRRNVWASLTSRFKSKYHNSKFKYKPLDPKGSEIRLLRLSPGIAASPIHCSLFHVRMRRQPSYATLSYEWADRGNPETIFVDGCPFEITRNLHAALTRLRSQTDVRVLWIDALCIDQTNIAERNEQVTKMIDVYRAAEMVIIWAGEATHDSSLAIQCVRRHDGVAEDDFHPSSEEIKAVESLFDRTYFYRAWVAQEIFSAKKGLVCCGDEAVDWTKIKSFYSLCFNNFSKGNLAPDIGSLHPFFLEPDDDDAFPLHAFRDREASDARDYVFAFVGMIPELQKPNFVDYSQSVEEVFKKTAILLIKETERLDQILFAVPNDGNNFILPSWAPDWSQLPLAGVKGLSGRASPTIFSAADDTAAQISVIGDTLRCKGFRFGTVAKLGVTCPRTREWMKPVLETFMIWQEFLPSELVLEENFQKAFYVGCLNFLPDEYECLYGMIVGMTKSLLPDLPIPPHLEKYLKEEPGPDFELSVKGQDYESIINGAANVAGRRLMITGDQEPGLALDATEVGDILCILLGCSYPVVLRPEGEGFRLISFAMLDGFMDGEAMDGLSVGRYELRDFDIV